MQGKIRSALESIRYIAENFPCVTLLGPRQIGKTTLLKQLQPNSYCFDLEKQTDFSRISSDPDFFLESEKKPIVIDEAQVLPELFPALRVAIDFNRKQNGQFLISGSSSPKLLSGITESLAGRVALFELNGFSLGEFFSRPLSAFYSIISEKKPELLLNLRSAYSTEELWQACLLGGYPEIVLNPQDRFRRLWFENYVETYIKRDIKNLFPNISSETFQSFIRMLASASGNQINFSNFARSLDVSQPTAKNYFRIAEGTFLWRYLESYHTHATKRVLKMPKGHLRDSGLLCHMLRIHQIEDLKNNMHFGLIWEGFVIEQILKEFSNQLIKVVPSYYRTQDQAEVDLILEGPFGLLPIEIKVGFRTETKQLNSLKNFIKEHNCPYGIVINNSPAPAQLAENIYQIPAGCL